MAISRAQLIAQNKYAKNHLDSITFKVRKGKRDEYKTAAFERGVGFMEMIRQAIEEYIANHPPKIAE